MAGLLDFVLPAIFSAGDSAKRQIKGLLGDPVGTVKQFINNKNDEAKAHLADVKLSTQGRMAGLLGGQATPEQIAADQKVNQALANAYNPAGMIVWHGSPHNFTKFDASKIGTGEGAQAYGHGLYLAESKDLADVYRKKLTGIDGSAVAHPDHSLQVKIGQLQNQIQQLRQSDNPAASSMIRAYESRIAELNNAGNLYKVDLPDEHIAKMLDWDKPLSQQAPEVQSALKSAGVADIDNWLQTGLLGSEAYKRAKMGAPTKLPLRQIDDEIFAAQKLRDAGIPGIRYLDGGSRGAGQGTSNFVIFPQQEHLLTILERNGVPLR